MKHKDIETLSVGDLFVSGVYVIPIYQRNYAWEEGEVKQLLQDVYDFSNAYPDKNYFIGTLVVYDRNENGRTIYETIDGQQRLTTLNIIYGVLHREFSNEIHTKIEYRLNLKFDSRKKSTESLAVISQTDNHLDFDSGGDFNAKIINAYEVTHKNLKSLFKNNTDALVQFYNYLSEKVHILRVSVPKDTNLNHYFEIMNTRGEQLEKHEILKSNLMEVISREEKSSYIFHLIWEACSDMERYVQYGFNTTERDKIFTEKNWNLLRVNSFDDLYNCVEYKADCQKINNLKLSEIVHHNGNFDVNIDHKEDAPERFNSIINFQNFLLHILRIQTKENISLDDKRLVESFDDILNSKTPEGKTTFVKNFAFNLLKGKFLFDHYIIKREFAKEKDGWSLKSLKWYEGKKVSYVNSFDNEENNNRLLMLLSMFHVSAPTLIYKHWLNASLYFLFENNHNMNAQKYLEWLENLAQSYLYDRYLAKDAEVDFYDIIYKNDANAQNKSVLENQNWDGLNTGTSVENFIFNYLDYILWLEKIDGHQNFEFTFRSSVEHYYPQNPISSSDKLDQEVLDKFGNLCLISRSKNSSLGRYMPEAKKDHYVRVKPDSLKQRLMMNEPKWEKEQIQEHTMQMIDKLKNYKFY